PPARRDLVGRRLPVVSQRRDLGEQTTRPDGPESPRNVVTSARRDPQPSDDDPPARHRPHEQRPARLRLPLRLDHAPPHGSEYAPARLPGDPAPPPRRHSWS